MQKYWKLIALIVVAFVIGLYINKPKASTEE